MPGLVSLHSPTPSEGGDRFADYVGLLRHNTSKSGDEQISLKEDVDRMMEGQNDIQYITGESI